MLDLTFRRTVPVDAHVERNVKRALALQSHRVRAVRRSFIGP
jgi:hypothetical protein